MNVACCHSKTVFHRKKSLDVQKIHRINDYTKCKTMLIHFFMQFRNLDVPTSVRLGELLTHLQGKGEEACREFYRALHLHVEDVYYSLPTRLRLRGKSKNFV